MPATLPASVGRAFGLVKSAISQSRTRSIISTTGITEAIKKVQRLRDRFAQIDAELAEHAQRFVRYTEQCRKEFESTKSFESERVFFLAQIIEKHYRENGVSPSEKARMIYGYGAIGQTRQDETLTKLATECPEWRKDLELVLALRVEIAERAYEETLGIVRKQLAGYDGDNVANDPRVKHAKYGLSHWQGIQSQFESAENLKAWEIAISALDEI